MPFKSTTFAIGNVIRGDTTGREFAVQILGRRKPTAGSSHRLIDVKCLYCGECREVAYTTLHKWMQCGRSTNWGRTWDCSCNDGTWPTPRDYVPIPGDLTGRLFKGQLVGAYEVLSFDDDAVYCECCACPARHRFTYQQLVSQSPCSCS